MTPGSNRKLYYWIFFLKRIIIDKWLLWKGLRMVVSITYMGQMQSSMNLHQINISYFIRKKTYIKGKEIRDLK